MPCVPVTSPWSPQKCCPSFSPGASTAPVTLPHCLSYNSQMLSSGQTQRTPRHRLDVSRPDSEDTISDSCSFSRSFQFVLYPRLAFVPRLLRPLPAGPASAPGRPPGTPGCAGFAVAGPTAPVAGVPLALPLLDSFSLKGAVTWELFGGEPVSLSSTVTNRAPSLWVVTTFFPKDCWSMNLRK